MLCNDVLVDMQLLGRIFLYECSNSNVSTFLEPHVVFRSDPFLCFRVQVVPAAPNIFVIKTFEICKRCIDFWAYNAVDYGPCCKEKSSRWTWFLPKTEGLVCGRAPRHP